MAYLHENKEEFIDLIYSASESYGVLPIVVEKDYYVTIVLELLAKNLGFVVFKGGTSLSKCHKVIKRFSEDIDITTNCKPTSSQMKKLKECIKDIALKLNMAIPNIEDTRSRRNYNKYILEYQSILNGFDETVQSQIILETSFTEISFPTVKLPIGCYISDVLTKNKIINLNEYHLERFEMKVQGLDRTLADKVFAICDYYMEDKVKKHSRHIYDIYKLLPYVSLDSEYKNLVREVREIRSNASVCPSAKANVDIPKLLKEIIDSNVYKIDYNNITKRILEEDVEYSVAIDALRKIIQSKVFD